jgi:hypothetical protein
MWLPAVLLLTLIAALPTPVMGQSETPSSVPGTSAGPSTAGSLPPGEALSVDVPTGALPAGTSVTVVTRQPSERPDELAGVAVNLPFYELQPTDATFNAPVTVTRSIGFGELGIEHYDPDVDGLIVGSLFTRASDGTWSWLKDVQVALDTANSAFTLTGTTDHGGPILAYLPGNLIAATEDETATPVGQPFRVEGQLRVDPQSRADIAAVTGTTSDESIAAPGQSYDVQAFDRAEGMAFDCLAPGTVQYETMFSLSNLADVSPLNVAISLGATDVTVTQAGSHTCQ